MGKLGGGEEGKNYANGVARAPTGVGRLGTMVGWAKGKNIQLRGAWNSPA